MAPKAGLQSRTPESPKISPTPKNPEARKSRLAAAASQQVATQTGCPSRRTRNRRAIRECAERSIRVVTWPPRVNELAQSRLKVKVGLSGALHCNASSAHPIGALDTRTRIEPSRVSFCFLLSALCTLLSVACCLWPTRLAGCCCCCCTLSRSKLLSPTTRRAGFVLGFGSRKTPEGCDSCELRAIGSHSGSDLIRARARARLSGATCARLPDWPTAPVGATSSGKRAQVEPASWLLWERKRVGGGQSLSLAAASARSVSVAVSLAVSVPVSVAASAVVATEPRVRGP